MTTNRHWVAISCATVLLLLVTNQGQRRLEENRMATPPSWQSAIDFHVYYVAGAVARQGRSARLYYPPGQMNLSYATSTYMVNWVKPDTQWGAAARSAGLEATQPYIYPPLFAVFTRPLSRLSLPTAYLLWTGLSAALLLGSIVLVLLMVESRPFIPILIISAVAAFSFFPTIELFLLGQAGALVLFLWTLGTYFSAKNRILGSALCFAASTVLKVTPVLAVSVFLLRRQWKWLLAYTAFLVVLVGIGIWQAGWVNNVSFVTQVMPVLGCGVGGYTSKSLPTLIRNLYFHRVPLVMGEAPPIPAGLCLFNKIAGVLILCTTLFLFWRKRKSADGIVEELVTLALVSLLISPVSWRHHYVLALLPMLYLWMTARGGAFWSDRKLIMIALATFLLGTPVADYVVVHSKNIPAVQMLAAALGALSTLTLIMLALWSDSRGPGATHAQFLFAWRSIYKPMR